MKAVLLQAFGGPENLKSASLPDPAPGPGQVLLRVRACALNHLDLWVRQGIPSAKIKLPFVLGCDAAGEVAALGSGVSNVQLGAAVAVHPGRACGTCRSCREGREPDCPDYGIMGAYGSIPGAYAELLAVPADRLLPLPKGLSFIEAASLPLTALTAWHMLKTLAELKAGETLLVTGAGAGVAAAAIQIGRALGARVLAASTSAEKLERAKALGAAAGILHPPEDLSRAARKLTEGAMCDVVFEHVGGAMLMDAIKTLRPSGRLVTCGATADPETTIDLRYVFMRQLRLLGAKMGNQEEMRAVWTLVRDGRLKAVVDKTFPLEDAGKAHAYLESRAAFGKVVLTP